MIHGQRNVKLLFMKLQKVAKEAPTRHIPHSLIILQS